MRAKHLGCSNKSIGPSFIFFSMILASVTLTGLKASDVMTDVQSDVKSVSIYGKIVDQKQKPIEGASVLLWESSGELSMESKSNGAGEFKFEHTPSGKLSLQVIPAARMKLASALLPDLPGDETRKMIIELKRGFLVTGRVTHGGVGLKGLIIRVKASENADHRTKVHGGGTAETGRGGAFSLILTGGEKKLIVINDKYSDCSKRLEKTIEVNDDSHLGKIELP